MVWGKEKNKMNANLMPENAQEEKLAKRLEEIRHSTELQSFLLKIKSEIEILGISHFITRVKKTGSAIRKFRVEGHKAVDELDDLCGIMVVTEDLSQLYRASEVMEKIISEGESIDLNNNTKFVGAAPLSYLIRTKVKVQDIEESVPIEIRIQEKTRFITIEALYYTLYKNDEMQGEEKWALNEVMMQIMRRQAQIDENVCDDDTKEEMRREIKNIVTENIEILERNRHVVYEAWKEYARVRYEYANNVEIEASTLFNPNALKELDDIIEGEFDKAYQRFKQERGDNETEFPREPEVEKAIETIHKLEYRKLMERMKEKSNKKEEEEK